MNGDYRTVHWTRHECVLTNPAHWSEVDKAFSFMRAKAENLELGTGPVTVEGRDEELVVWFDERQEVKP